MNRLLAKICSQSLRFVYAAKISRPPTLNNCKWCPQSCPGSRRPSFLFGRNRYGCSCDTFCNEKWPNLLLTTKIRCRFPSDCGCDAVVHSVKAFFARATFHANRCCHICLSLVGRQEDPAFQIPTSQNCSFGLVYGHFSPFSVERLRSIKRLANQPG